MKKSLLCVLPSLLVVTPCAAHAQYNLRANKTPVYDRVTDSTTWSFGKSDRVLFHAQGEQPTCASSITVLLFDVYMSTYASRQAMLPPGPVTFRLLIDSAGVLTRTSIEGRAVEAPLGGLSTVQYVYPVPDSLTARFRAASVVEGVDNRSHKFRWDQQKLSEAPPICPPA